jgi:hypothetical protein
MGLLRGSRRADGEDESRDDAAKGRDDAAKDDALARIEAGGIPLSAERRLQALGQDGALFTSRLSVNEFALLGAVRSSPRPRARSDRERPPSG